MVRCTLVSVNRTEDFTQPNLPLFAPHPNLGDGVNRDLAQSEIEGGVHLSRLPNGTILEIITENRCYWLEYRGRGRAMLSGHPQFCPQPVLVCIQGSTWGGSMLRAAFIGRGMRLEFRHPSFQTVVTSRIVEIREHRY